MCLEEVGRHFFLKTMFSFLLTALISSKNLFFKVFNGSYNKDEVKTVYLPELKKLRFLRIKPTEWHGGIALRMEIYGCMKG